MPLRDTQTEAYRQRILEQSPANSGRAGMSLRQFGKAGPYAVKIASQEATRRSYLPGQYGIGDILAGRALVERLCS